MKTRKNNKTKKFRKKKGGYRKPLPPWKGTSPPANGDPHRVAVTSLYMKLVKDGQLDPYFTKSDIDNELLQYSDDDEGRAKMWSYLKKRYGYNKAVPPPGFEVIIKRFNFLKSNVIENIAYILKKNRVDSLLPQIKKKTCSELKNTDVNIRTLEKAYKKKIIEGVKKEGLNQINLRIEIDKTKEEHIFKLFILDFYGINLEYRLECSTASRNPFNKNFLVRYIMLEPYVTYWEEETKYHKVLRLPLADFPLGPSEKDYDALLPWGSDKKSQRIRHPSLKAISGIRS